MIAVSHETRSFIHFKSLGHVACETVTNINAQKRVLFRSLQNVSKMILFGTTRSFDSASLSRDNFADCTKFIMRPTIVSKIRSDIQLNGS